MGHEMGTRIMFLFHWLTLSILVEYFLPSPLSLTLCSLFTDDMIAYISYPKILPMFTNS